MASSSTIRSRSATTCASARTPRWPDASGSPAAPASVAAARLGEGRSLLATSNSPMTCTYRPGPWAPSRAPGQGLIPAYIRFRRTAIGAALPCCFGTSTGSRNVSGCSSGSSPIFTQRNESMDIQEILAHLPHRYPMLLVDRGLECEPGKRILAIKNVTINEPFFSGHFPHHPVMPGVLVVEAMAPAAAILSFSPPGTKPDEESVYYFVGIDGARFKRPVTPGDQLVLEVLLERS